VLLRRPWAFFFALFTLVKGRLALKEHFVRLGHVNGETLPIREDFLEYLKAERNKGRELYLATGAAQAVADAVAARLEIFSSASGSGSGVNLKGKHKLDHLRRRFPEGFAYAGNDRSDVAVWRGASSIILVGATSGTRRAAARLGTPIEREFPPDRVGLRDWLKAIRIHQWSKNFLLFVPLMLAHKYGDISAILTILSGFVALGCVASGTYLINDLSDLEADRAHATKCNRLIARGSIGALTAMVASLTLIGAGLFGGAIIGKAFCALLVLYIATTLSYSLRLKTVPMFDVFMLACLYTLRIYMGIVLLSVAPSPWLLAFSMFFFFSLSMAKRHVEIVRARQNSVGSGLIKGRGYQASDEPLTLTFGVASGLAAILILFLYVANDAYPVGAYKYPGWLWLIGFFMFLWVSRIWLLSHRGELDDDPVSFAVRDPLSLLIGAFVAGIFALAVV
jgi:4-hydroxybenzoate polyprenyltransferase